VVHRVSTRVCFGDADEGVFAATIAQERVPRVAPIGAPHRAQLFGATKRHRRWPDRTRASGPSSNRPSAALGGLLNGRAAAGGEGGRSIAKEALPRDGPWRTRPAQGSLRRSVDGRASSREDSGSSLRSGSFLHTRRFHESARYRDVLR
jgi:hypothetical protein